MNNLYDVLFVISVFLGFVGLLFIVRWLNDARCVGWRLRRFHERAVSRDKREWKEWFAWRPVRTISGELIWWDTVYRQLGNTYSDQEDWNWYYYGTIFDVIANG